MKKPLSSLELFLLGLALLCGIANLWCHNVFLSPLPIFDETFYFQSGQDIWKLKFASWDWSPLVGFLYVPFANPWIPQDIAFHLFRLFLTLATLLLMYLGFRKVSNTYLAFFVTLYFSLSARLIWENSSHVVAWDVSLLALLCFLEEDPSLGIAVLTLGFFVRAEFWLMAGVVVLVELARKGPRAIRWTPTLAIAALAVAYTLAFPDHDTISRSSEAFMEHYAWSLSDMKVWQGDSFSGYQVPVLRDFGKLNMSIPDFYRANPAAFRAHVLHNVTIVPWYLFGAFAIHALRPDWSHAETFLPYAFLLLGLAAFLARNRVPFLRADGFDAVDLGVKIGWAAWLSLAALAFYPAWLLIRPRSSYQIMAIPFFLALALACLERARASARAHRARP